MKNIIIVWAVLMMLPLMGTAQADRTENAMVKIYTIQSNPDYINPWNLEQPQMISGSGCIIDNQRILTNAHVVSNQTFVQVRAYGESRKFDAYVLYVSHNADLAILTTKEPAFFDDKPHLTLGDLPIIQQPVAVYGFPEGGDTLSITAGVVSRVEHSWYAHSFQQLLAIQVDAAVNDGNSGGPVLADGKIIGLPCSPWMMRTISAIWYPRRPYGNSLKISKMAYWMAYRRWASVSRGWRIPPSKHAMALPRSRPAFSSIMSSRVLQPMG